MKVVAYVPDLMDRSRFSVLPEGIDISFVSSPDGLDRQADVHVADLGRPGVVGALAGIDGRKIGFISHVDDATRVEAVAAGIVVFARSAFFSRLVAVITK